MLLLGGSPPPSYRRRNFRPGGETDVRTRTRERDKDSRDRGSRNRQKFRSYRDQPFRPSHGNGGPGNSHQNSAQASKMTLTNGCSCTHDKSNETTEGPEREHPRPAASPTGNNTSTTSSGGDNASVTSGCNNCANSCNAGGNSSHHQTDHHHSHSCNSGTEEDEKAVTYVEAPPPAVNPWRVNANAASVIAKKTPTPSVSNVTTTGSSSSGASNGSVDGKSGPELKNVRSSQPHVNQVNMSNAKTTSSSNIQKPQNEVQANGEKKTVAAVVANRSVGESVNLEKRGETANSNLPGSKVSNVVKATGGAANVQSCDDESKVGTGGQQNHASSTTSSSTSAHQLGQNKREFRHLLYCYLFLAHFLWSFCYLI